MKEIRVPEERVGVVIGSGGDTKQDIEKMTQCDLEINDNVVKIDGDAFDELTAEKIVKALGRGFSPERAINLVEEDVTFHMLDIKRFEETKNGRERIKGRVIGKDGETRRHIEKETNTEISVYGSTIGFIGKAQNIEIALEAVRMLLNGATHTTAYTYIEQNQSKIAR